MPNLNSVLREEINRLSKKQARSMVAPVRTWTIGSRRAVAELKRRVAALEKANSLLKAELKRLAAAQPAKAEEETPKARFTAKGVRSLRRRLRLSGKDFARLLGVTGQAAYSWERSSGALRLREKTKAAVLAVRGMGAREAKQRLAEMEKAGEPAPKGRRAKTRKPVTKGRKAARRAG